MGIDYNENDKYKVKWKKSYWSVKIWIGIIEFWEIVV